MRRQEQNPINAILRWAGSKRRLVPRLQPFWTDRHDRYVEPFAGSACLFFALEPQQAILGDLNVDLMETYEAIRDDPDAVSARLDEWGTDKASYYQVRDECTELDEKSQRAARFIYLNRLCFNGLYRTNRAGHFNVPYGAQRAGPMPDRQTLRLTARLLTETHLVPGDFSQVLRMVRPGDLVYMDPPYRVSSRRVFREYQAGEFSSDDLVRLRKWLEKLDSDGVDFVVSYADSREGRRLSEGFASRRVQVRRNIAGFAKYRRTAYEILVTNSHAAWLSPNTADATGRVT